MAVPLASAALSGVRSGRAFGTAALSEEPKTDISLPREKLLRAKEIKARKKIPRENRQNAEMEGAAWLRTGLCPATPSPPRPRWVPRCHLQRFPLLAALIPLGELRAEWEKSSGPFHKQRVAEHCAVFRDLFRGAALPPGSP
ncbi:large ribosomal subunit protein mL38-like [Patagioenas fasciata]|uniref:large ribosomal subunit protein mL38-like n=1 Tax=Patagioenas fasciata TaxID=372321 RepID=UPI0032E93691